MIEKPIVKGIQLFYGIDQVSKLNTKLIPHLTLTQYSPCLENHYIRRFIEEKVHLDCDYFGVFSWRFENKHAKKIDLDKIDGKHDVYSYFGLHKKNVWVVAERWHKGITALSHDLLSKAGFEIEDLTKLKTDAVYQNAFWAKPEIYHRYVKEMLIPVMDVMKDDERLNVNSGYKGQANVARMQIIFNRPYYTLHAFICERLFSTWCAINKIKIKQI